MDIDLHGALKVSMALGALGTALFAAERAATITTFSVPGAVGTFANCINQAGTSAGYWVDSSNFPAHIGRHDYLVQCAGCGYYLGARHPHLQHQHGRDGHGTHADSANTYHGFILTSGGTFTAINAPRTISAPGKNTSPQSINDGGAVTGYYQNTGSTTRGFVYTPKGTIISFDAPNAGSTESQGTYGESINDAVVVAGYYFDQFFVYHGFQLTTYSTVTEFDAPGAGTGPDQGTLTTAINAAEIIVGNYAKAATQLTERRT